MGRTRHPRPLSPTAFERTLRDEVHIAREYRRPLTVLVVALEEGWTAERTGRALAMLRAADPVSVLTDLELALALVNTGVEGACPVVRRLREHVPELRAGVAALEPLEGGEGEDLISCARRNLGRCSDSRRDRSPSL